MTEGKFEKETSTRAFNKQLNNLCVIYDALRDASYHNKIIIYILNKLFMLDKKGLGLKLQNIWLNYKNEEATLDHTLSRVIALARDDEASRNRITQLECERVERERINKLKPIDTGFKDKNGIAIMSNHILYFYTL